LFASSSDLLVTDEGQRIAGTPVSSPFRDAVRRFRRNWAAVASVIVVAVLIFMAVFAHYMHTTDPTALDYNSLSQGPSATHWFGTDTEGRDEYTRILYGLRVPSNDTVTMAVCNFTGGTFPALSSFPIRTVTFG